MVEQVVYKCSVGHVTFYPLLVGAKDYMLCRVCQKQTYEVSAEELLGQHKPEHRCPTCNSKIAFDVNLI